MSIGFHNVIAFITIFGVLVFLHELGHFVLAKVFGVQVEVFSLGFGPRLFGWRRRETDYRVSLVPLGGYVKMIGEGPEAEWVDDPRHRRENETASPPTDTEAPAATAPIVPHSFAAKPRWQRLLVMAAGGVMNILLAVALVAALNTVGRRVPAFVGETPRVGKVKTGSPADQAGMRPGDRIIRVDEREIRNWEQLQQEVLFNPGRNVVITVDRGGTQLDLPVAIGLPPEGSRESRYGIGYLGVEEPAYDVAVADVMPGLAAARAGLRAGDVLVSIEGEPVFSTRDVSRLVEARAGKETRIRVRRDGAELDLLVTPGEAQGRGFLGIHQGPELRTETYPPLSALVESLRENRRRVSLFFEVLGKLVTGRLSLRAVSGPVDIFLFSGEAWRQGFPEYVDLMASFSLQLGILNLLPIPFLDGGHIAILLVEGVRRRDLSLRLKERLMQLGFVALLLFMGLVLYSDIAKNLDLFQGWFR